MAFIGLLIIFVVFVLLIAGTITLIVGIVIKIKKRQSKKYNIASNILIVISVLMLTPTILMSASGAISKHKRNNKYGTLYLNAKNRNWDKVVSLINKGMEPDGEYHITLLMEACRSKEFEMVKFLTENGAIITEKILLKSCEYDNVEVLKLLIQSDHNNFVFNSNPLVVASDFTKY